MSSDNEEIEELETPLEEDENKEIPNPEILDNVTDKEPAGPENQEWEREFPNKASENTLSYFKNYLMDEVGFNPEKSTTDILGNLEFDENEDELIVNYRFEEDIIETHEDVRRPFLLEAGSEALEKAIESETYFADIQVKDTEEYTLEIEFRTDKEYSVHAAEDIGETLPIIEEDLGLTRYSTPEDLYE